MASSTLSPLSLAYMIEISFVLNLAYHELNTFKLRESFKEAAKEMGKRFEKMDQSDLLLIDPEWGYLKNFHTGESSAAWEEKWIRGYYNKFVYNCRDRVITKWLIATVVLMVMVCTFLVGIAIPIPAWVWWIGYAILVISMVIPVGFMGLNRKCKFYAGCLEENSDQKGRLHDLEQKVLEKLLALEARSIT